MVRYVPRCSSMSALCIPECVPSTKRYTIRCNYVNVVVSVFQRRLLPFLAIYKVGSRVLCLEVGLGWCCQCSLAMWRVSIRDREGFFFVKATHTALWQTSFLANPKRTGAAMRWDDTPTSLLNRASFPAINCRNYTGSPYLFFLYSFLLAFPFCDVLFLLDSRSFEVDTGRKWTCCTIVVRLELDTARESGNSIFPSLGSPFSAFPMKLRIVCDVSFQNKWKILYSCRVLDTQVKWPS